MSTRLAPVKPRPEVPEAADFKDYKIPAALLVAGILIYLFAALVMGGVPAFTAMLVYLPIRLGVQIVLGVIAVMLTVKIMGTAFGYAGSAILKLAAVFVFPGAVTFFIPWIGWILALLLYWGLLEWLFELDAMETIVLVMVIFLVNSGALLLLAFAGFAAG